MGELRLLKHLHIIDGCFSHLAVVLGAGFKAIPLGSISIYPDMRTDAVREVFAVRLLLSEKLHQFDADGVNSTFLAVEDLYIQRIVMIGISACSEADICPDLIPQRDETVPTYEGGVGILSLEQFPKLLFKEVQGIPPKLRRLVCFA